MKKLLLVFSLSIFSAVFWAQTKDTFFKDYVSKTWTVEDGMPGNSITDIYQSKEGYIYFGTYGGLTRFDGVRFLTYNKYYDSRYGFLSARSIMQDSKGNFWVGSNDEGAYCLRPSGDIISFTTENGLTNNSIRSFCEDKDGNIWIGTASGVNCVGKDYKLEKREGFNDIPLDNHFIVAQMYCDTAGRIWIVTRAENGLYVYANEKFSIYDGIHVINNPVVTAINQDSNGAYWFGIAPYYAVKISADEEVLHNLGYGAQKGTIVSTIYQDSARNIWFGLDNGITIYHDGLYSYYDKSKGLSDDSVGKIIEDKEKNIWIATDHGGVQKLSYGKFQTVGMHTTVNAIAQDSFRKVVWIAGDNGLYCYQNNSFITNSITEYCKNVRIRHLSVTKNGALLVSTYEKFGQLKFNLDGSVQAWTKDKGIIGNRVRVAEELANGDLYIGTTTGLSIVDGKTGKIQNITKGEDLDNDYIMCLYENPDGTVWVGTDGGGIFILKDREIVKKITKETGLAGNVVFKIQSFKDGEIWICTGTGASYYKNGRIFNFNSSNGFNTDGIFQLIPDISGRIWGTSNRGIFYIKENDAMDVLDGRKVNVSMKFYGRLDGITSGGITSTSLSMKDDMGRVWFTLIDGFTIFDPVRNASKNSPPEVKIEDVIVDGEKYPVIDGTIVLPAETKRLNINYTGISFISSEQIMFKTKLAGFEEKYSDWSDIRIASYTNLGPGEYTFSVIAENGDEVQSLNAASIKIIKESFIWQRPGFIVFVLAMITTVICLLVSLKLYSLKKQQRKTEKFFIEVIEAFVGTIDAKDKYTNGHSTRVAKYSKMLASAYGLNDEEIKEIYYAAMLHDIGKIGIPDSIINKPEKLTDAEYNIIKTHSVIGSQILSSISSMKNIAVGVRGHHERFDGKGYPDGLQGTDIPLIARIITVADAYDAMTSNRSYRKFMAQEDARSEIVKNRGIQFDPEIADKMIEIIDADEEYKLHE